MHIFSPAATANISDNTARKLGRVENDNIINYDDIINNRAYGQYFNATEVSGKYRTSYVSNPVGSGVNIHIASWFIIKAVGSEIPTLYLHVGVTGTQPSYNLFLGGAAGKGLTLDTTIAAIPAYTIMGGIYTSNLNSLQNWRDLVIPPGSELVFVMQGAGDALISLVRWLEMPI